MEAITIKVRENTLADVVRIPDVPVPLPIAGVGEQLTPRDIYRD